MDFRSDTLTKPTPEMRQAMITADVGDDVYGEDLTIQRLEAMGAELLGQEAALFCVSGSLANMLGLWLTVERGSEALCDSQAHIVRAEMGAHAGMHGITTRTWRSPVGVARLEDIEPLVSFVGGYLVKTSTIEIENTMNFASGAIQPLSNVQHIAQYCRDNDLALHLDGARLANACVATGTSLADYGRLATTVSLCLSKGLGAPVGTLLASSKENIAKARVQRKRLGAGWRQAGILAAAGIYALENNIERLAEDHQGARAFADEVRAVAPWAVATEIPTNIVVIGTGSLTADEVVAQAGTQGMIVTKLAAREVRVVTYLGITHEDCVTGGKILASILKNAEQS
ncbi:MAG: threonine aldolase family protein [Propionibacteriaceae bacterium]|jgi:threonine aldolase|nr:threonine aldolase family protein [Propionibacteriaceae bacterium]